MKSSDLGFILVIGAFAGLVFISALCWSSAAMQSMITRMADIFPLLTNIIITAIIGAMVFAIVKGALHLYGHAVHIKHVYPDAGGAFPLVESGKSYIDLMPESVRLVQALSDSHLAAGKKPNATAVRDAITASRAPIIDATPLPELTNGIAQFDITSIDPRTAPHWLFIGQTGSGKSTAAYTVLDQLRRSYDAEFILCEPGGVDWNTQSDHIDYDDIADAIEVEYKTMSERQEHLRQHDVNHIADLPSAMPYRYLVLEEADSLFDNLNRDRAKDALFHLRELARMGRKTGIGLIALSQTALADIFNTHVRGNLNNVFLFRGSQQIARNWGVSKLIDLPSLPPGRAYDLAFERTIQFPNASRPDLKRPAIKRATNAAIAPILHKNAALAGVITLPTEPSHLTNMQKRHMLATYKATGGYRPALRALGLSEGGHWFYVLKEIVQERKI